MAEIEYLKACKFWRQHNEKSSGFQKWLVTTRESQDIYHTQLTQSQGSTCNSNAKNITAVKYFYSQLYMPDQVDEASLETIVAHFSDSLKLDSIQQDLLTLSITINDILQHSRRSPRKSSPDSDGLSYKILHLIMSLSPFEPLIC